MKKKYIPHDYQRTASEFLYKNKYSMLFADCGIGKSAIALSLIHKLINASEIRGVLFVCPLRVAQLTIPMELEKWDAFRSLSYTFLHGKDKDNIKEAYDIYIINFEGLPWLFKYLKQNKQNIPFDMLCIDESSKVKGSSTNRFKMLKAMLPLFRRRILMSGTPAPNSYQDLFSQTYLTVGITSPLTKYITHYRDNFFDKSWNGFTYTIKKGAAAKIDALIAPLVYRIKSDNKVPITYTDIEIALPPAVMKGYKQLEKDKFLEIGDDVITSVNAAVLLNKLRQYIGGAVYTDEGVKHIHDAKIAAIGRITGPVIVVYEYKHELSRLKERYPTSVVFSEGDQADTLEKWNKGKINRLLIHPQSAAHGLNLQQGGSKLVWFTLSWSLENYLQANGRIWRQGQKNPVEIVHLIVNNTVDILVKTVLESKGDRQQALLDAMAAYRMSMSST